MEYLHNHLEERTIWSLLDGSKSLAQTIGFSSLLESKDIMCVVRYKEFDSGSGTYIVKEENISEELEEKFIERYQEYFDLYIEHLISELEYTLKHKTGGLHFDNIECEFDSEDKERIDICLSGDFENPFDLGKEEDSYIEFQENLGEIEIVSPNFELRYHELLSDTLIDLEIYFDGDKLRDIRVLIFNLFERIYETLNINKSNVSDNYNNFIEKKVNELID